jgi:hypothetical protein
MLCPRFAVLREGRLAAVTTPEDARGELAGSIYEGTVAGDELTAFAERHCVTQAILVAGRNRVRIHLAEGDPPNGFEPVSPTLEDAYLMLMRSPNGNGAEPEEKAA